ESQREPAKVSAKTPGAQRTLYILSGALVTLLAVLGFFLWPQTTSVVKARAKVHAKPLSQQQRSDAATESTSSQSAKNDVATGPDQSFPFDQPFASDQPPFALDELLTLEQPPTPEQP